MSQVVNVTGTPTLTLNDGGTASYTGGTGTNALTFTYTVAAGQNSSDLAVTAFNLGAATIKDGVGNAADLTAAVTNPAGTLQIDTTVPTVTQVVTSPASGVEFPGTIITLALAFSEAVNVTGTPTLTLNDGGSATYTGGTGTSTLTFSYTVGSNDSAVSALAITQVNLPNGTGIRDAAGNAANLSGAMTTFPNLAIDPPLVATLVSIADTPSNGDLDAGTTIALTLNLTSAVTVAGGVPTLSLNDGGTATYTGGSGSSALTFRYTVASGQNTASLAATAVNLKGATVLDAGGKAASLSLTGLPQIGPQIDTTAPTVTQVVTSPGSGEVTSGQMVSITLDMSEAAIVSGSPTLLLNDGGSATFDAQRSSANALVFDYTVAPNQVTTDLRVSGLLLPIGSSVHDLAGNSAVLFGAGADLGLQVNTTTVGAAGPGGGSFSIAGGATLELFGASKAHVTFASTTGELKLDSSLSFTGSISGLTGADALDLSDVSYGATTVARFGGNVSGGLLGVTDGSHMTHIVLLGNYTTSSWTLASDGNGGTTVVDPPATTAGSEFLAVSSSIN